MISDTERRMLLLNDFLRDEDGQDMIEYGLVIALVVLGATAAYSAFEVQISTALSTLGSNIVAQL
jgi:Flp pilus assembly pilin Flp